MAVADEHAATVIGAGHSGTSGTSVLMTIVGARVAPNSGHAKMGLMTDPAVAVPEGYPQLLEQLKAQVRRAGVHASRVVNTELLTLYWNLGRAILDRQDAEGWGTKVIDQLAVDLRAAFPEMRGLSRSNLKYMRQMASTWPRTAIGQQAVGQLPWGISQPASCSCGSAVQRFSGSAVQRFSGIRWRSPRRSAGRGAARRSGGGAERGSSSSSGTHRPVGERPGP